MAHCKLCFAPIRWATGPDGRWLPLDARAIADGEVVVAMVDGAARATFVEVRTSSSSSSAARDEVGTFRLVAPPDKAKRYTSHLRTCAHRVRW